MESAKVESKANNHSDIHQVDVSAVNSSQTRDLYQKRQQIYPKNVNGTYRFLKWAVLIALLGIYYLAPILRWARPTGSSQQMVLADFTNRRFYFGPIEIWPQEVYYIAGLLILAAVGLFLATSLFGRVWCGYACPQTVWTDLYIWVETLFEGDRNQRIRLDKAPWSFDKVWRKTLKHIVWFLIALFTGGWFVMYFNDSYEVIGGFLTGKAPLSSYVFAGAMTFTTYSLAGMMREQVCTYMCPWPRIQGAMLDHHAQSVTYRSDRGEPRGPHKKNQTWEGRGDCVDCRQCIAVCPAGIDIRDGLQIECINCGLCIDACDEIMEKVGRPKRLIAFDTQDNIILRKKGEKPIYKYLRGRTLAYSAIIVGVGGIMLYTLLNRNTMQIDVIRDRAPLFVPLSDGNVRNTYTIKFINKSGDERKIAFYVEGVNGAIVKSNDGEIKDNKLVLDVKADDVTTTKIFIVADPAKQSGASEKILLIAEDTKDNSKTNSKSVFISANQ